MYVKAIISGKIYELKEVLCPTCASRVLIDKSKNQIIFTCPECKSKNLVKFSTYGYGIITIEAQNKTS